MRCEISVGEERAIKKGAVFMNTTNPKQTENKDRAFYDRDRSRTNWSVAAVLVILILVLIGTFWLGRQFWTDNGSGLSFSAPQSSQSSSSNGAHMLALSENTIANLAEESSKSVVSINTDTNITIGESPFEQFFNLRDEHQSMPRLHHRTNASGLIVREDGYILTNNHVVRNADTITVKTSDNRVFDGKVVGRDSSTDLALIKINAKSLPVARFGNSKSMKPGDWAIAIGSPMGLSHTVTLGIISALQRPFTNRIDLIQTDAAINPGNSGGPLLNIHGEVIGINTATLGNAQNIGFAIPVDIAKSVVKQLLEKGKVERAWVGVYMQDVHAPAASIRGVRIVRIEPGSPAEVANLRRGDIIQEIDNAMISTSNDVRRIVDQHHPNDLLRLLITRNGRQMDMTLRLGDFPQQTSN